MTSTTLGIDGIGPLHRSAAGLRLAKLRSRISAGRLDVELAAGADPWGSHERMLRAQSLTSAPQRRVLAESIECLVKTAEEQRINLPATPTLRHRLVLELRDQLLALAERLRQPEPVEVRVIAELVLLLRDGRSPIYVGGRPPRDVLPTVERLLRFLQVESR